MRDEGSVPYGLLLGVARDAVGQLAGTVALLVQGAAALLERLGGSFSGDGASSLRLRLKVKCEPAVGARAPTAESEVSYSGPTSGYLHGHHHRRRAAAARGPR